ncbi:hypothetical protein SDC9_83897 [bioreactor metagenome]|uniref:Uncharacterized protein n=1 Tax=bioreactor metagenome TaxID=1076179 RepID=A0A644ZAH3_9ZZZZ
MDAVGFNVLVQNLSHFVVHGRHDLIEHFHDGDVQSGVAEVLRYLQADKTAADDCR